MGTDISRDWLDFHFEGHAKRFENSSRGADALGGLARRLARKTRRRPMVVMEATGSYHVLLVRALEAAGIAFLVLNPKRARDFARACGQFAKTDPIDAAVLARIGSALALAPRPAAPPSVRSLQALESLRDAFVSDLVAWKNRRHACPERTILKYINAQVRQLAGRVARIERDIAEHIDSDQKLAARQDAMLGVCGVGPRTAAVLLAWMPELGSLRSKAAAALAGAAPFPCESGAFRGKRVCWGGRPRPREALWMASLSAKRFSPVLRPVYLALVARGKPEKVARTALIRKLVVHINTLLKPLAYQRYEGVN